MNIRDSIPILLGERYAQGPWWYFVVDLMSSRSALIIGDIYKIYNIMKENR